jgi:hypothetical protein
MKVYTQLASLIVFVVICFISLIRAEQQTSAKLEAWLISFHDTTESSKVEDLTTWLNERKYPIDTTINESYIKFIVANMSADGVEELKQQKDMFGIENIELDDLVWDSMDKSEL